MLQPSRSARARASRRIAADPTSTALLLAAPTAVDLWPNTRRIGEAGGRVLVEALRPAADGDTGRWGARVAVHVLPPRRTPTAYVVRFTWSGELPPVSGRLTLAYAPTADGTPATHAALELEPVHESEGYAGLSLTGMAEGFLGNLARAAERRNRAA